jgi:hypothetical protein
MCGTRPRDSWALATIDDVRIRKQKQRNERAFSSFMSRALRALDKEPRRDHILEHITQLRKLFDRQHQEQRAA